MPGEGLGIKEYIEWRGDVPFYVDPFGEVDALVLAELSYLPFEGLLAKDGCTDYLPEHLTLRDAAERFDKKAVDEKLRIYTFDNDAELLFLAGTSERFGDIVIRAYSAKLSAGLEQQFAAAAFDLPDGTRFIAFRGTDDSIVGWKEDFNFSYMSETPAQKLAAEYLEANAGVGPVIVGGHSKGGNLAVYSAARCSDEVRSRIKIVYSFDGPGFRDETARSEGFLRIVPLVKSIIPESSLVGQLLTEGTEHIIIRSCGSGVMQHNAYTWQVKRSRFVRTEELSGFGAFINRTVNGWLSEMNDEDRRMFTKALFDVIGASEADTFGELSKSGNRLKASAALIKAVSALRPEQQKAVRRALKLLARNSTQALKELAEEKIQPALPKKDTEKPAREDKQPDA